MELFIVKMNRWGNEELHSYIEGVYETRELAEAAGKAERSYRDNKYEPEIVPLILNRNRHRAD